jgi:hypothetical protein
MGIFSKIISNIDKKNKDISSGYSYYIAFLLLEKYG